MDLVLLWMEKEGFVGVEVGGVIQLEILLGRMDLEGGRLEVGSYSSSPGERTWAELGQVWHAGR